MTTAGHERVWKLAGGLLVLGIAWRLLRYVLDFPLWWDEALLALNLMDSRSAAEALRPLREQVAPVLFIWVEWAAMRLLGPGELVLRFLPFVASVAALLLFVRVARRAPETLATVLAVGILSVAYFPVRFAAEVKPYTFDLLSAVAFLVLALQWLDDTNRLGPLLLIALLAPVAVALSYPSVFILATLGIVLFPRLHRHPDVRARLLALAGGVLAGAVFYVSYLAVGVEQFEASGGFLRAYWSESFPPARPGSLLAWLVAAHTGNLFAYPLGDVAGAGAATFAACIIGAVSLYRSGARETVALLVLPFGFTLAAATLRLYPYGPHPRVAQHLAPSICLLAGTGLAAALGFRSPSAARTRRRAAVAGGVLALIGVAGIVIDVVQPFKSPADAIIRSVVSTMASQARPGDGVVFVATMGQPPTPPMEFYLRRSGLEVFPSLTSALRPKPVPMHLWVIAYPASTVPGDVKEVLLGARPRFVPEEDRVYSLKNGVDRRPSVPCSVSRWGRESE
ncbi:MAG TPA: glycosyltransferase family 39 protein [Thermoanaerobaculia bacterium]|nr:glycosyltransferase family 39 protein [Thermoanaerobaculia bacterium]